MLLLASRQPIGILLKYVFSPIYSIPFEIYSVPNKNSNAEYRDTWINWQLDLLFIHLFAHQIKTFLLLLGVFPLFAIWRHFTSALVLNALTQFVGCQALLTDDEKQKDSS